MNCECFQVDSSMMLMHILTLDYTKFHKVFLRIPIINNSHYRLYRSIKLINNLHNLDRSKIIVLSYPLNRRRSVAELNAEYIAVAEWHVKIMPIHSNHIFNQYNFIYTNTLSKVFDHYSYNKITVVLCWYDVSTQFYERCKQFNSYVNILIVPRMAGHLCRAHYFERGVHKLIWNDDPKLFRPIRYFQLRDKAVIVR